MHETKKASVKNYTAIVQNMSSYEFESDLFPIQALKAYSDYNMGRKIADVDKKWFNNQRGGGQGDYRNNMTLKIAVVVDCLNKYPKSKRAFISIPNSTTLHHSDTSEMKCMREIHFEIDDDDKLNSTVFMRAQAAEIFPKNIHFIGTLMEEVAARTGSTVGKMFYHAVNLVSSRDD